MPPFIIGLEAGSGKYWILAGRGRFESTTGCSEEELLWQRTGKSFFKPNQYYKLSSPQKIQYHAIALR